MRGDDKRKHAHASHVGTACKPFIIDESNLSPEYASVVKSNLSWENMNSPASHFNPDASREHDEVQEAQMPLPVPWHLVLLYISLQECIIPAGANRHIVSSCVLGVSASKQVQRGRTAGRFGEDTLSPSDSSFSIYTLSLC